MVQVLGVCIRKGREVGHSWVGSDSLLLELFSSNAPASDDALQKAGLPMYDLRRQLQTGVPPDAPVAGPKPAGARPPDRALRRRPMPRLRGVLSVSPVFLGLLAVVVVIGVLLWVGFFPQGIGVLTLAFVVTGWVATVCVHEFCHALGAYIARGSAVASSGYLTLDPLRYTSFLMSIVFPAAFLLIGGIALPGGAVCINLGPLRDRCGGS